MEGLRLGVACWIRDHARIAWNHHPCTAPRSITIAYSRCTRFLRVSGNGKFFIVRGSPSGKTIDSTFGLHERQAGTKPPRVAEGERYEDKVVVDSGDRLIRKGILEQRPWDAWLLSGTPWSVLFEEYRGLGNRRRSLFSSRADW